jgi:hypothetical protein
VKIKKLNVKNVQGQGFLAKIFMILDVVIYVMEVDILKNMDVNNVRGKVLYKYIVNNQ